jgi:hypothetical protein
LLKLFPIKGGEAARLSDALISRARLLWDLARRPVRSCGEPKAATDDAASRDERATVARYMARCQRENGGREKCGNRLRGGWTLRVDAADVGTRGGGRKQRAVRWGLCDKPCVAH